MGAPLSHKERAKIHAMSDAGYPKAAIARALKCSWPTVHACLKRGDRAPLEEMIAAIKAAEGDLCHITAFEALKKVMEGLEGIQANGADSK